MKKILFACIAVVLLASCTSRSQRLAEINSEKAEKMVILEVVKISAAGGSADYKVKVISSNTSKFIRVPCVTGVYAVNDTIMN